MVQEQRGLTSLSTNTSDTNKTPLQKPGSFICKLLGYRQGLSHNRCSTEAPNRFRGKPLPDGSVIGFSRSSHNPFREDAPRKRRLPSMSKSALDVLDAEIAALTTTLRQLKSTRAALCRHLALLNRAAPKKRLKKAAKRAKALKPDASPATSSKPAPGDRMPDGTIYVGVSPDTERALFAKPDDEPSEYTWDKAREIAAAQTFGGHTDWRLPTYQELDLLYRARTAVGGFWEGRECFYWSSTASGSSYAFYQDFLNGFESDDIKQKAYRVRCVRSG